MDGFKSPIRVACQRISGQQTNSRKLRAINHSATPPFVFFLLRLDLYKSTTVTNQPPFAYRFWTIMTPTPWVPDSYPPTHRSDHVDVYQSASKGEVPVSDPYQWLEESSNEVDQWTTTQTAFTQAYLDKNPDRQKLEDMFLASKDYAKVVDDDDRCIRSICAETLLVVLGSNSAWWRTLVLVLR